MCQPIQDELHVHNPFFVFYISGKSHREILVKDLEARLPSISVCPRLWFFTGYKTFSAKARTVGTLLEDGSEATAHTDGHLPAASP
jgi:hypothetical protein